MGVEFTPHALKLWKGEPIADRIMRPVAGLEAEFSLLIDDRPAKPEHIFGDPLGFITVPLAHRTGRSFQLPTGGAIYFDTGVIEIATPVMELERGCFGRLSRSLDEAVTFVREQLDGWERRSGKRAQLRGFSAHYNVSITSRGGTLRAPSDRLQELAWLLVHILPAPVMLLATNKRSTGVGLRPRPRRMEVTADFPPDPDRMAATGAVIAGIIEGVRRWRDLRPSALRKRGIPVVEGFQPMPHTTRRGWLARFDCYPANPFACEPDAQVWKTTTGTMSMREIARRIFTAFSEPIARFADESSYTLAERILSGVSPSWLDQHDRPTAYDDVGRRTRYPGALHQLGLSRYERVILNALEQRSLMLGDERWTPVSVRGWSRVVFKRDRDGARTVLPLDTLVQYLPEWESS